MENNQWIDKKLENGYTYHLREFTNETKQQEIKPLKEEHQNPTVKKIKINKVRQPIGVVAILLTKDNELVGYVESHLFEDKKANIHASSSMPQILAERFGIIQNSFPAIYTDEKYRRKGIGTELLKILFEYLVPKGIKNVDVEGIVNEGALQFYEKNGAKKLNNTTAVFEDIENILQNLQRKEDIQIEH